MSPKKPPPSAPGGKPAGAGSPPPPAAPEPAPPPRTREGPPIEPLLRRLAETPGDFRDEPRIGTSGRIHVVAVVGDLCARLGVEAAPAELAAFGGSDVWRDRNRLAIVLLQAWLLADPDQPWAGWLSAGLPATLAASAAELSPHTAAARFVDDAERREELARHMLARLGLRPAGESEAQAQDRLTSLSAAERARVLAAAKAAEARAREIREALARKAAEESADKWTRE